MHELSYHHADLIPIFKCGLCGECKSVEADNSFGINRGCCFYFPKYTLTNIRYLAGHDPEFLEKLRLLPDTIIKDYDLMVQGDLDLDGLQAVMNSENEGTSDNGPAERFDPALRFRKCRFITEQGCSIQFNQRPHPCNLYLCRSVIENCGAAYRPFARERKDYFGFMQYSDQVLKEALQERNLTLRSDFSGAVTVLLETYLDSFDFAELNSINFHAK